MMDLRQMRYFLNVAEQGSFHGASDVLNVAQSAISRQIQHLEYDVGATLFLRSTKGVTLSPAGEVLLAEVREILARAEEAKNRTWRAARGQFGRVVIAYTTRVGEMRYAIAAFADARAAMPDVDFQLKFIAPERQHAMLAAGEIDVGLLYLRDHDARGVRYHALRTDQIKLLVPDDHGLTQQANLKLADLKDYPFAFTSQHIAPHMYNEVFAACIKGGLTPRIMVEAPQESIMVQVVQAGLAIGFCDESIVERRPIPGLRLLTVEDLRPKLTTVAMWKEERANAAIDEFVTHLVRRISESAGTA